MLLSSRVGVDSARGEEQPYTIVLILRDGRCEGWRGRAKMVDVLGAAKEEQIYAVNRFHSLRTF